MGAAREVVLVKADVDIGDHPTPSHPDRDGCGWPAALEIEVGADWRSGYYDIVLTDQDGASARHFICVKPAAGSAGGAALVLATNTYYAYNWWGGANAYCDVTGLMTGRLPFPEAMAGAIGVLSTERPFSSLIVGAPDDSPRLVNLRKRGFQEEPWAADREWMLSHQCSPYDGSAGYLNKWEHAFVAWAEGEGYQLDFYTDHDLDAEPEVLSTYACALFVGHSEYWSGPEREQVERFVDGGGKLAVFSGNTCFWKVRWEDDGKRFICHKWRGFEADPAAQEGELTHLWSHPRIGKPEAELTGLTFLYAGYHRLGMCAARGAGGYTVYDDRHWALQGADLFYGDTFGAELPLLGYENDGCRFEFGPDNLPRAVPGLGVPQNLEIIALAPCVFGEEADRGYAPIIPPERMDVVAEVVFGDASPESQLRALRGHAVMAAFKRGAGEVFNAGATEWAHALKARDPFVEVITRNVLDRFGAAKVA